MSNETEPVKLITPSVVEVLAENLSQTSAWKAGQAREAFEAADEAKEEWRLALAAWSAEDKKLRSAHDRYTAAVQRASELLTTAFKAAESAQHVAADIEVAGWIQDRGYVSDHNGTSTSKMNRAWWRGAGDGKREWIVEWQRRDTVAYYYPPGPTEHPSNGQETPIRIAEDATNLNQVKAAALLLKLVPGWELTKRR